MRCSDDTSDVSRELSAGPYRGRPHENHRETGQASRFRLSVRHIEELNESKVKRVFGIRRACSRFRLSSARANSLSEGPSKSRIFARTFGAELFYRDNQTYLYCTQDAVSVLGSIRGPTLRVHEHGAEATVEALVLSKDWKSHPLYKTETGPLPRKPAACRCSR